MGFRHTPETIARISAAHLGVKQSPERRAQNSLTQKRRVRTAADMKHVLRMAAGRIGTKHMAETIAKMAERRRGTRHSEQTLMKMRVSSQRRWAMFAAALAKAKPDFSNVVAGVDTTAPQP